MNTLIPISICLLWAVVTWKFIYSTMLEVNGKIAQRPRLISWPFIINFQIMWGIPVVIFLAIWGGVFWW
jgi:hypothetical protein